MTTTLQDLGAAIRHAVEAAADAVVTVGGGTGVVVADGQVLTNAHNLRREHLTVRVPDGRRVEATVMAADLDGDLALLATDTDGSSPITWSEAEVDLGDPVVGLARPRHRGLAASLGSVAVVGSRFRGPRGTVITGAFEHTARLPRGSSGGPLVDPDGRLLGINTHRRSDGYYAAVPADDRLRDRIAQLAAGEVTARPRLGVAIAPPHVAARLRSAVGLEPRQGLLVREVDPDGTAAAAGIERGDLIVAVDDQPTEEPADLQGHLVPGIEQVILTIVRGTDERQVTVRFPTSTAEDA